MKDATSRDAPQLWGLAVAGGLALAAFGAAWVAIGLSSAGAVLVASLVFAVAALILALPGAAPPGPRAAARARAEADAADTRAAAPAPAAAAAAPPPAPVEPAPVEPAPVGPAPAAPTAAAPVAPARPQGLAAPRGGVPDDLKQIKGIGPKLEELCHRLGYFHFDQIAAWGPAEVAWVDENLEGFRGRVTRDGWVEQARLLAAGGTTEFSRRVAHGDVYRGSDGPNT